MRAAEGIQGA